MTIWNLNEIDKALTCKFQIKENLKFKDISIDSRTIKKGNLFIPISGKNFDGHDFINDAFKNGAIASLVEEKKINQIKKNKSRLITVKNTLNSLKKLAIYSRQRSNNTEFICITGSSGKTTLKEWLKSIIELKLKTHCNFGNFNNEIGMPLTLARMPRNTKICILELGMNRPGEIKKLTKIAKPSIAIITSIGNAHIGNFSGIKDIAHEKSQILQNLKQSSSAIIPKDCIFFPELKEIAKTNTKNIYTFGYAEKSNFKIFKKPNTQGLSIFSIMEEKIKLRTRRKFKYIWEMNVSIILGILKILNIPYFELKKEIESLNLIKGRGAVYKITINKKKITLIDESYNSNPNSLEQSLKNLCSKTYFFKRKICIIGDMMELGKFSKKLHENALKAVLSAKPDVVLTLGKFTKYIHVNLPKKIKAFHFNNFKNVYNTLLELLKDNDVVMIKGSNSTSLNKVSKKLIKKK